MNELLIVIIIAVIFVTIFFIVSKRKASNTGGTRFTSIRMRGGNKEVYDDNTGAWVLMALVLSELDFDSKPYDNIDNGCMPYSSDSTDSYSSSSSSDYSGGGDYGGGGDCGGD